MANDEFRCFIGGLAWSTSGRGLKEAFEKFGHLLEAKVFKCFCNEITEDGLLRMLKVIKKDLKPACYRNPDSEDDDDAEDLLGVEEAEESAEAETGETGDSDEQTTRESRDFSKKRSIKSWM